MNSVCLERCVSEEVIANSTRGNAWTELECRLLLLSEGEIPVVTPEQARTGMFQGEPWWLAQTCLARTVLRILAHDEARDGCSLGSTYGNILHRSEGSLEPCCGGPRVAQLDAGAS